MSDSQNKKANTNTTEVPSMISFNIKNNITTFDHFLAYPNGLVNKWVPLLRYLRTFRNPYQVAKATRDSNFPIKANLRDGRLLYINSTLEAALIAHGYSNFEFQNEHIIFKTKDFRELKFSGWQNGDLLGIFFLQTCKILPVKDKEIIDIGANIADSSIYFILRGAKRVIGIEPSPKNYKFAVNNVKQNKLSENIDLKLAACCGINGHIQVNDEQAGVGFNFRENKKNGFTIPLLTLDDIISYCKTDFPLLKIDVEGWEYQIILSALNETLQKFSHIQIEYHYGHKNLKSKLEKCGFRVTNTFPLHYRLPKVNDLYYGYLYAEKFS